MLAKESLATTLVLASLVALGPMSTDMYLPALPAMTTAFGTDVDQVQLTLSVFLVGFAVSQLFYGGLSDRFGRKPIMLFALVLFTLATVGCALATSIEALIGFRFLQAVGACAGPVLGRAMVRDIHGRERSAQVLSHMGTAMALAPAVAPIIGGYLTVAFGWQAVFVFLAGYGLLGTLGFGLMIPESLASKDHHATHPVHVLKNFKALLNHRAYVGYVLSCSFVYAGLFAFLSGSSFVVIEHFGVREEHFGLLFALVVLGYMSGTQIGARLSLRLGVNRLLGSGALLAAAAGLLMALLALLPVDHLAAVIAPMVVFMVGVGMVMPQSMAGALAPFPHMAGAASALLGFFQMTIAALAGIAVGQLHDGTPIAMASMIALMGLATLASFIVLVQRPVAKLQV